MRAWLATPLLLVLLVATTAAQAPQSESDCKRSYADPDEYEKHRQETEVKLGRGVTIHRDFGCGKAQIDGHSDRPFSAEEWKNQRAWLLQQLEDIKPLGHLVEERVQSSLLALNGRFYVVDRYEHGYMQYTLQYGIGNEGTPPTVSEFVVYYPQVVSGVVASAEAAHEAGVGPPDKNGQSALWGQLHVFLVSLKDGRQFIVSQDEFAKLKVGAQAKFEGFGPLDQWVV